MQLLQFHNSCCYIKSCVERERDYQAQKGISKSEVGLKRPRNPMVVIPLDKGNSTKNATIKYTLNH